MVWFYLFPRMVNTSPSLSEILIQDLFISKQAPCYIRMIITPWSWLFLVLLGSNTDCPEGADYGRWSDGVCRRESTLEGWNSLASYHRLLSQAIVSPKYTQMTLWINNRDPLSNTCDSWGIKRFQTRWSLVWNCFIPHESQVSIYHNQGVVDSLSGSPINTNKGVF